MYKSDIWGVILLAGVLLSGIALVIVGAVVLSPHNTVYQGEVSSVNVDINKVIVALQNPTYTDMVYKTCNFGDFEVLKFKVVVPNDECSFPFGTGAGNLPWTQLVPIIIGGVMLAIFASLVWTWVTDG